MISIMKRIRNLRNPQRKISMNDNSYNMYYVCNVNNQGYVNNQGHGNNQGHDNTQGHVNTQGHDNTQCHAT